MAYKLPDKYDAILGADLHIRESVPACRIDDYINAQWTKLLFIQNLCEKNGCPFLVAGDLFDHWKPSPYLLSRCIIIAQADDHGARSA
jgi:DNA repair exonuclease SbcCD nuclease subunit